MSIFQIMKAITRCLSKGTVKLRKQRRKALSFQTLNWHSGIQQTHYIRK